MRGRRAASIVLLAAVTVWAASSAAGAPTGYSADPEAAFDALRSTHHILGDVLFVIAVLHILAALKHHFWNKDDVLLRMLPFVKLDRAKSEDRS